MRYIGKIDYVDFDEYAEGIFYMFKRQDYSNSISAKLNNVHVDVSTVSKGAYSCQITKRLISVQTKKE